MENIATKPLHWRLNTLLSLGTEHVHELALRAAGSMTSLRLLLGRCLLALHENKGYKEFGCSSAVHYATQILGIGDREARECRRVARELQPLPELTLAAEAGSIVWSKLREVVRKASPETENYWLSLCGPFNSGQIQDLVKRTPWGSLPGEVAEEEELVSTELRCPLAPRVFRMLAEARRLYSIEQDEAVTNADILEAALASYIAGRPVDTEVLNKAREEADKDLQAQEARGLPLVQKARAIAEEMGLLGEAPAEEQGEEEQATEAELIAVALGTPSLEEPEQPSEPKRLTCVAELELPQASWTNPRLRFNPHKRLATKAQRREILRRDGWKCSVPGCCSSVWLHLHHLKSYAEGGETKPENVASLCAGCHRNLHAGLLQISVNTEGKLIYLDAEGRRLDRSVNLEMAGWLDWWHGWKGREEDSHYARVYHGVWEVAV